MDIGSLLGIYSVLLGLALGSFINVCVYRIPAGKSIVSPRSSCPDCGAKIKFYDNIPLVSYLLLLGRCRQCGKPISWRYPLIEILSGFLSLALFTRYGFGYQYILYLFFASTLLIISFIDLEHQIIPDVLSLSGLIAGWIISLIPGGVSWIDSLIGIIVGGGALFAVGYIYELIAGKEGMGGGDVKLLAMIGAWMGWKPLLPIIMIASMSGALIGSAFLLLSGKGLRVRIPFGPFLALGALVCLLLGPEIIDWYFSTLS